MDFFTPRKLLFKAWNKETKLLMRLNSIDCKKGELYKKDHVLLQFTGLTDKGGDEIYDMDVVLINAEKYIVLWSEERNGWNLAHLNNRKISEPLSQAKVGMATRLWSYFETENR